MFYLEGDKLTHTDTVENTIPILPEYPGTIINQKPYPIPEAHKEEVQRHVSKLLEAKITPSRSPWSFPIVIVPKKMDASGKPKMRICFDFS